MASLYDDVFGKYGDYSTEITVENWKQITPKLAVILILLSDNSLEDKHIAFICNCSVQTVKNQQKDIKAILRVNNRVGAVNAYNTVLAFREYVDSTAITSEVYDSAMTRKKLMFSHNERDYATATMLWKIWINKYNNGSKKLYTD